MSTAIVAFDASTARGVIVAGRIDAGGRGELLAHDDRDAPPNQTSDQLVPRIAMVFTRAGLTPADLDAVACGCGPGTFTGTRVAVATAKGIAAGLRCPVVRVDTLLAVALSIAEPRPFTGDVLGVLDARRSEVYAALYRVSRDDHGWPSVEVRMPPVCDQLGVILARAELVSQHGFAAVGPGVGAYPDAFSAVSIATDIVGPTPRGLWEATGAALRGGAAVSPAEVDAAYLRKSYAELGLNRPKRAVGRSPFWPPKPEPSP